MVNEPMRIAAAGKKRRGILTKKLFRDMVRSAMQFVAMMLLCFLGTWCFSGLDTNWRTMDLSFSTYFEENNAADLWVKGADFSRLDIARAGHIEGVSELIARSDITVDCPDLGDDVTLSVIAYDGEMSINKPYLTDGELLPDGDTRGILIEQQFALAQGLNPGDSIVLDIEGQRITFTVRGIVLSPEYIVTSKDIAPSPETYGFALINYDSVSFLPYTEMVITLEDGADEETVKSAIEEQLPGCLIQNRRTNGGTVVSTNYVDMFRSLSYLFPVLVYAVATMIVVSTLKRMIENQRIQLGTLKALGFPGGKIRRHYLVYALVPSLIGSLAGIFAGRYTLPQAIWEMLSHNARMPYLLLAPVSAASWAAFAVMVLLSLVVCRVVYEKAAGESTADLLRPKPPKSGSRILLERWKGLWKRLSFNTKMVIRNIFRNKGRSFLSFVGVFCCNMLIVCSFTLQVSIPGFISDYYTKTQDYDIRAELDSSKSGTLESYQSRLEAEMVEGIMEVSISAKGPLQSRACLLTVIPDGQSLLKLGENQTLLEMPKEGVCVSEKLLKLLGLNLGDEITFGITGDDDTLTLPITLVAHTNIGQGIFMSRDVWESCRKGGFAPTVLLIRGASEQALQEIDEMDEIKTLKYPEDQNNQTVSIMDSTTTMFSILSGAALLLAFIICYNMGLMNFTERTRDYATLKVLGYHQHEIRSLMMREQNVISIVATVAGVYPGMLLTKVILAMCEFDSMVFVPSYPPKPILLACAISIGFAWFIELFLTRKVKKIDMVEALKSVE